MQAFFSPMFRVKLETMLRIVQTHGGNLHKQYGYEVGQTFFEALLNDSLMVLYCTRRDYTVDYGTQDGIEYNLFHSMITDAFDNLNKETRALFGQKIEPAVLIGKFNSMITATCDKLVNDLNREFFQLHNQNSHNNGKRA